MLTFALGFLAGAATIVGMIVLALYASGVIADAYANEYEGDF